MADVEVSYKGSTIGSLSASGSLTLETEGYYCEDDITVAYTSPGGGGGGAGDIVGDYAALHSAIVTVGANSVTNMQNLKAYLLGLANAPATVYDFWYGIIDAPSPFYNMILGNVVSGGSGLGAAEGSRRAYRYRNGSYGVVPIDNAGYDAAVQSGMKYFVVYATEEATPT